MKTISIYLRRTHGIVVRPGHSCCCPACGERGFWINDENSFGRCGFIGCKFRIGFGLPPKVKAVEIEDDPNVGLFRNYANGKKP